MTFLLPQASLQTRREKEENRHGLIGHWGSLVARCNFTPTSLRSSTRVQWSSAMQRRTFVSFCRPFESCSLVNIHSCEREELNCDVNDVGIGSIQKCVIFSNFSYPWKGYFATLSDVLAEISRWFLRRYDWMSFRVKAKLYLKVWRVSWTDFYLDVWLKYFTRQARLIWFPIWRILSDFFFFFFFLAFELLQIFPYFEIL